MLKILFVDDDAVARRNMAQRIDWNDLGWDLVYTARDGVDALEYMRCCSPSWKMRFIMDCGPAGPMEP